MKNWAERLSIQRNNTILQICSMGKGLLMSILFVQDKRMHRLFCK